MSGRSLLTRFTEGDCHILARAIHEATGWPMATFVSEDGEPDLHAFVKLPNGRFLDIEGISTEMDMYTRWMPCRRQIALWHSVEELFDAAPNWIEWIEWPSSPKIAPRAAHDLLWHTHGIR